MQREKKGLHDSEGVWGQELPGNRASKKNGDSVGMGSESNCPIRDSERSKSGKEGGAGKTRRSTVGWKDIKSDHAGGGITLSERGAAQILGAA